ncbi:glycerol kinase 5-like [Glandiceps talaboti]
MSSDSKRQKCDTAYVLAVDIGTTTVRCHIYDKQVNIVGESDQKLKVLQVQSGCKEIDPDSLWLQFTQVVKDALTNAKLKASDISTMGISTHRASFTLWEKEDGKVLHNFITWQDTRSAAYVDSVNKSLSYGLVKNGARFLHLVTRQNRWRMASQLSFSTQHAIMRLGWYLEKNPELKRRASAGQILYGAIDTWLIWKLTGGKKHLTDYSNASASCMFDPFVMNWNWIYFALLGLPMSILPQILDTCDDYGCCTADIFGAEIPIGAVVADQQSAMFGQCCFNKGDVKCTMGTGTFLDINVGNQAVPSKTGLYSLVCWKIKDEVVFVAEGNSADTGTAVEWGQKIGLYSDVSETSTLARSVSDSNGTYFIPAFSGIQAPVNDDSACCAFIGIKPTTSKQHMVRGILESFVFRFKQLLDTAAAEIKFPLSDTIRMDGGVGNNEFVVQLLSDLANKRVDLAKNLDAASLGAAFFAGLQAGIWKSKEELKELRESRQIFQPKNIQENYDKVLRDWERSLKRCKRWNIDNGT